MYHGERHDKRGEAQGAGKLVTGNRQQGRSFVFKNPEMEWNGVIDGRYSVGFRYPNRPGQEHM
jgi:hypothetical protein